MVKKIESTNTKNEAKMGGIIEFYIIVKFKSSVEWHNPRKWFRSMGSESSA